MTCSHSPGDEVLEIQSKRAITNVGKGAKQVLDQLCRPWRVGLGIQRCIGLKMRICSGRFPHFICLGRALRFYFQPRSKGLHSASWSVQRGYSRRREGHRAKGLGFSPCGLLYIDSPGMHGRLFRC